MQNVPADNRAILVRAPRSSFQEVQTLAPSPYANAMDRIRVSHALFFGLLPAQVNHASNIEGNTTMPVQSVLELG